MYLQCQRQFPDIVQNIPKPDLFSPQASSPMATVAHQSPPVPASARQPWPEPPTAPPASSPATVADSGSALFSDRRNGARTRGCAFCGLLAHRIHGCATARQYADTGRVKIVNNRLHLPTGQPIPNDGRGLGLQASVDAWLSTNKQPFSDTTASNVQRDEPPRPKPPSPPPAPTTSSARSTSPGCSPQYRYQESAEDQALIKQLATWCFEGNLNQVTPAHILAAACPSIREEILKRLELRDVETGSFDDDASDQVSVLEPATKRKAAFSSPLLEIDVLVNNHSTEAGVLSQGSPIVIIREDLANEVGARINTRRTVRIEDMNGNTSRTLGCAEDLDMRVGDVSFTIHAHVVRSAPSRLLLGWPFHHLLSCRQEYHSDRVDVSIRDPADPSRSVAVPSRARRAAQVGFVTAFACQVRPDSEPPRA